MRKRFDTCPWAAAALFSGLAIFFAFCEKTPGTPVVSSSTSTLASSSTATSTLAQTTTIPNSTTTTISSTTTTIAGSNNIRVSLVPSSGTSNSIVKANIEIIGNTSSISAFGLDLGFETTMFSFDGVERGPLTAAWATVDGSLIAAGIVRAGGFAGGASSIPSGSTGTILAVRLRVLCPACPNGQQSNICITNYTDGIAAMIPKPVCSTFTFTR